MWSTTPPPILVGVASPGCQAALAVAALEAERRGCGVHLLQVVPPLPAPPGPALTALTAARLRLAELLRGSTPVTTAIHHGDPVRALVEESDRACLVVVQHDGPHALPESSTSVSVASQVAERAAAPTLLVPATWTRSAGPELAVVSVGVEMTGPVGCAEVVRVALAEADVRDARLRLVHGWAADGVPPLSASATTARSHLLVEQIRADFADVLLERPDVPVDVVAVPVSPVAALLEQVDSSSLLVVGRRRRVDHLTPLGPVALAVGAAASCPVLVVDPFPVPRRSSQLDVATAVIP